MPKEQSAEALRPRRVALESHHTGITLTYRWFSWFSIFAEIFFIFWSVVWIGSFSRWLRENLLSVGLMERFGVWLLLEGLFLLFGAALGILAIYGSIAHLVNRTVITVTESEMTVRESPFLYRENITIPTPEVSRIHIEEVVSEFEGTRTAKYRLTAVLKDDQRLALISDSYIGLDEARFLAQKISERLSIEIEFDSRR
jgi:hypothetical protein